MRVVFMGSPEFAVPSLEALVLHHEVAAVYTRPDRARGRGSAMVPTPVKEAALRAGIPVEHPGTLRDPGVVAKLRAYAPDVICVAAYGLILPPDVLGIPVHGCLNVHGSLLPRHRGAAPVHRAILEGDETIGVSIMRMEEGLDTGPYTHVRTIAVGDHTVETLTATLAELGAEALLDTLSYMEAGTVEWVAQDDAAATYAAKVTDEDVRLSPDIGVRQADRRIRASSPSARAKLVLCGRRVDVLKAHIDGYRVSAGHVDIVAGKLLIGFSDGTLALDRVRAEGKAPVDGHAFACGARPGSDERWEPTA